MTEAVLKQASELDKASYHSPFVCNLLRPLIKILFSLVPCGYIIIKKAPKEMTVCLCVLFRAYYSTAAMAW